MTSFGESPSDTYSRSDSTLHAAISFKVVEWSEQLISVISAWLGAVRRRVQIRLCTSGCKSEKMFGVISPLRDLLLPTAMLLQQVSG